ncbi:VTC domain protein [Polystyrenella longa]|uniref:VTC domain protein n=1 Tax=Polystyrenella longa TaxID=2528007 RepID=A0A518CLL4_9PLAN|nr:polyphosphate polymerase domain-containing protein [Polystyrenella longa]QDU80120.1 VTC domain protein [Polystyrenella longa]
MSRNHNEINSDKTTGPVKQQQTRIELKYLLDNQQSCAIKEWARKHLDSDPNCVPRGHDHYDVSTLYFDTQELDLYHRTGRVGRTKYRIRGYNDRETVWLETKTKKKVVVSKNRSAVSTEEFDRYLGQQNSSGARLEEPWSGRWFQDGLSEHLLIPIVQIGYQRFARLGVFDGEAMRLTIDNQLEASHATSNQLRTPSHERSIATPDILELKFNNQMPAPFKQLLSLFPLTLHGFSKYRTAVEACGIFSQVPEYHSCA